MYGWKKEVKTVIKIIFGVGTFLIGLAAVIAVKAIASSTAWMDDSFWWGGRDGNG